MVHQTVMHTKTPRAAAIEAPQATATEAVTANCIECETTNRFMGTLTHRIEDDVGVLHTNQSVNVSHLVNHNHLLQSTASDGHP